MAFFYNQDILRKAGIQEPPQTWDEVLQQSLKIKSAGLSEYPMMLSMARESWLIEFLSAMVFSHGGRFVDAKGAAVLAQPDGGAQRAMQWIVDAVQKHKIISPACVETGELQWSEGVWRRQPCIRLAEPLPHPHPERSQAVASGRQHAPGPDAGRPRRIPCHRRLDAVSCDDPAGGSRQDPRRQRRQADRVVRRQGRWPVQVPEAAVRRPRFGLRCAVAVPGPGGAVQLRQIRGHRHLRAAAKTGAQEGRDHALVRRVGRGQRHGLAVGGGRQVHGA